MLNMPPKLLPIITDFNNYMFFLLVGGRGGGKSQAVARLLLYLADQKRNLKILCGREIQARISESVHSMLSELIKQHNLPFDVLQDKIRHKTNGSEFHFRGFIDRGISGARGIEGYDILWVDEAQQLSKATVDDLIPSIIRKNKVRCFFTMNRYLQDDAVFTELYGQPNCLHIHINYYDNPFCNLDMKNKAMDCKEKTPKDYEHIWEGKPLAAADDYLFTYEMLHKSFDVFADTIYPIKQTVMGIDFAAHGNDKTVITLLERRDACVWELIEQIGWNEPDTNVSTGKIVNAIGKFKPTAASLDVGGMGHVIWHNLREIGINVHRFDGATTDRVDTKNYANARAEAYFLTREWFENGWLMMPKFAYETIKELEKIRIKYRSNGTRLIQAKLDMKKDLGYSPDNADSLMMAIWTACKHLGNSPSTFSNQQSFNIQRKPREVKHKK